MAFGPTTLPKMMLGFVVRRCTVEVGHKPSPEEFAAWANNHREGTRRYSLFGRPITVDEARVVLRHPGRVVTARSAPAHERVTDEEVPAKPGPRAKVTSLAAAMARLKARAK